MIDYNIRNNCFLGAIATPVDIAVVEEAVHGAAIEENRKFLKIF